MAKSTKGGSFVFKRCMRALVSDKKEYSTRTGGDMLEAFPSQVGAAYGKLFYLTRLLAFPNLIFFKSLTFKILRLKWIPTFYLML